MAVIENLSSDKAVADWQARFAEMSGSELLVQQICQRGAEHSLVELQKIGVTPENLQHMLDSLRHGLFTLEEAAQKRGVLLMSYSV
jgi:hypothetical protein